MSRLVCQRDQICLGLPGDRPEMFAPTMGFSGIADSMETCRGPIIVVAVTTFSLGAESNRLPACMSVCPSVCHAAPSYRFFFVVSRWNRANRGLFVLVGFDLLGFRSTANSF